MRNLMIIIGMVMMVLSTSCMSKSAKNAKIRQAVEQQAQDNMEKILKPYSSYSLMRITYQGEKKTVQKNSVIRIYEDVVTFKTDDVFMKFLITDDIEFREDHRGIPIALISLMGEDGVKADIVTDGNELMLTDEFGTVLFMYN